jgi:alkyldihydroxyacetonephosphate synthase
MGERLKFWGWGREGEVLSRDEEEYLGSLWGERFGADTANPLTPPGLDELGLRPPRLDPPASLAGICSTGEYDRAAHTYGKSFTELVRIFARDFTNPPDVVAFPETEDDVVALLDWCTDVDASAIPFGGGSSVVGGVSPPDGDRLSVSIDMRNFDAVLEVDRTSRAARIQAGIFGPALDARLKPHGLTLRHFPQSYEYSTLGGWIATRSGGHFVMLYTHIDELVESLRVVSPAGVSESFRTPGSGSGPSPDRWFIGSEGILGIITEAWMRLQDRPTFRASAAVRFADFDAGAEAVRVISQSGLYPTNCRLIDAQEAGISGAGDGEDSILVLGFESADHPLEPWLARALECCADHGGRHDDAGSEGTEAHRAGVAGRWRNAFLRGPYYREWLVARGIIRETFESAITWDRFPEFHRAVRQAAASAVRQVTRRDGTVTCRFTHIYPDGPAPYFTMHALGRPEAMAEQYQAIKEAASDAIHKLGGPITHHHAVGRHHRPWYDKQRPDPFAEALRAAKRSLDPGAVLNPGVLIDP